MDINNNSIPNRPPVYQAQMPEPRRRAEKYQKMIDQFKVFGIGSIVFGILFTVCLYNGFIGLAVTIVAAAIVTYLRIAFKFMGMAFQKKELFYITGILLLGISNVLTGDGALIFFNVLGILFLMFGWILTCFCDTTKWGFPKYLGEILKTCILPLGYVDAFFKSLSSHFKKKDGEKDSKSKYIWLGALFGIPFVFIVTALLSSADAVFGNMFHEIFKNIHFPEHLFRIIFLLLVGILGSFSILSYYADDVVSSDVVEKRNWEPLIAITFLSFSTVVYLIFSVVQILYLFIGGFELPEGYTYATYAHEGFYQLLAVCLINLIVIFTCISRFRDNLVLKIILSIFSVCTYIMLASSALRMVLYVQVYQLTYLRLLTLWGLLLIGIVLFGCIITIWKNSFFLFRYSMVAVTVLYLLLSFIRPGYVIAKYNLSDPNTDVDTYYIVSLNSDAIPVYLESAQFKKDLADAREMAIESNQEYRNWLYNELRHYVSWEEELGILHFDYSYTKAAKLIKEKVPEI